MISGSGKFQVNEKKQRKRRHSATGKAVMLAERRVVVYKYSWELRAKIKAIT